MNFNPFIETIKNVCLTRVQFNSLIPVYAKVQLLINEVNEESNLLV